MRLLVTASGLHREPLGRRRRPISAAGTGRPRRHGRRAQRRRRRTGPRRAELSRPVQEDGPESSPFWRAGRFSRTTILPERSREVRLQGDMRRPPVKLWDFDHPHLYRPRGLALARAARSSTGLDDRSASARSRSEGTEFLLNGEPVRLAGVERMAGSHPDFGMAEPASWIEHDHADLKELNCVLTRVHWQQDRRVLDYCDRHGILIQLEVPTWGAGTFQKPRTGPARGHRRQNGLEQLREMIARDRNHPCVFSWGLCNEVDGQNPRRPGVRPADAPGSQAPRSRPAVLLRLELAPDDARARRGRGDGLHRVERILRELVRRRSADAMRDEPRGHPPGLPRQAHRHPRSTATAPAPPTGRRTTRAGSRSSGPTTPSSAIVPGSPGSSSSTTTTTGPTSATRAGRPQAAGPRGRRRLRRPQALLRRLRAESSPVEALEARRDGRQGVRSRRPDAAGPARPTRSGATRLRWTAFGNGGHPARAGRDRLCPELAPGAAAKSRFAPEGAATSGPSARRAHAVDGPP
ncbi:MAG: hypothetical protein MZV49_06355 [Rhodopseudomonas palustris]|nr:hypothetical protein [Rhodopseudomonas palustris]